MWIRSKLPEVCEQARVVGKAVSEAVNASVVEIIRRSGRESCGKSPRSHNDHRLAKRHRAQSGAAHANKDVSGGVGRSGIGELSSQHHGMSSQVRIDAFCSSL